jgi:predicted deacylase
MITPSIERVTSLPETLVVGDVSAEPGETKCGPATWAELRDGTRVHLPVIIANGQKDGPRVVLTAATHPTELVGTAAVQIVTRRKIGASKLRGSIIAFPIANPFGMQLGEYLSPHDDLDMYVTYPGSKVATPTSRFANFIWNNATKRADLAVDFHQNMKPSIYWCTVPHTNNSDVEKQALTAAEAFGLTIIRTKLIHEPGVKPIDANYIEFCLENNVPAITPEFEGSTDMTFGEEQTAVRVAVRGLMNVLKKLTMIPGQIEPQSEIKVLKGRFEAYGALRTKRGGIVHRLAEVGVRLPKATPVAKVIGPYGDEVETVEMPVDGYLQDWTVTGTRTHFWTAQSGSIVSYIFVEK